MGAQKRRAEAQERQAKATQRTEEWIVAGGPARRAAWLARKAKEPPKDSDTMSEASFSTAASTMEERPSGPPRLSNEEDKEVRRYEKLLREIAKIEEKTAAGEKVDTLQRQKAQRRAEIEDTLVMRKLRTGYLRPSSGH